MKKLFFWQKIAISILAVLTALAVIFNAFEKQYFNIGIFFDLVIGIIINTLILYVIFIMINFIYNSFKKNK